MNERLFKEQKHNINYRKIYDDEMQSQRKYIAKIIILLSAVFILQRESIKFVQKYEITF